MRAHHPDRGTVWRGNEKVVHTAMVGEGAKYKHEPSEIGRRSNRDDVSEPSRQSRGS